MKKRKSLLTACVLTIAILILSFIFVHAINQQTSDTDSSDVLEINDIAEDVDTKVEVNYVVNLGIDENDDVLNKNVNRVEIIEKAMQQFHEELIQHLTASLDISLEDYTKIEMSEVSDIDPYLFIFVFHLPKEPGDKMPMIFLKNDTEGIILTQKADGRNIAYYIELVDEAWTIVETKSAQGIRMTISFE